MDQKYANVMPVQDVVKELEKLAPGQTRKVSHG
jgi:hypothetical protein